MTVACAVLAWGLLLAAVPAVTVEARATSRPEPVQVEPGAHVSRRVLVGVGAGQQGLARAQVGLQAGRVVSFYAPGGLLVVETPAQVPAAQWAKAVQGRPGVRFAEPDYVVRAADHAVPDDPLWPDLWGMERIDAPAAWHTSTGSASVVVGIMDSGIDYTHPDLGARMWHNPGETPGNGVDDDGNGWVDDIHGVDCRNGDGDPMDDFWHGTHVAGTVGAVGNNAAGVVGVNWDVRLMALKMLGSDGSASVLDAVTCLDYASEQGVRVTNASWTLSTYSQALDEAVGRARDAGQLVVAAAGNQGTDIDATPRYPAAFQHGNVVAVASSDPTDTLAPSSNFGAGSVDLAAPGVDILSTDLTTYGQYYVSSGTSMAAPHVTGVAALLLALDADLTYAELREHLLAGIDVVPGLAGKVTTGGRLNAAGAVASLLSASDPPDDPPPGEGPPEDPPGATYTVSSVDVVRGRGHGDPVTNLDEADGQMYRVTSERRGAQQWLEVQASATLADPAVASLTITWVRSYTMALTESFAVRRSNNRWEELSGATVGPDAQALTWTTTSPADYVGPAGDILVRVVAREPPGYTLHADRLVFTVEH